MRKRVAIGFHSLRHSAVSILRGAGAAQTVSMALVGHSSSEVHALYSHVDESALRRAVESMPAMIEASPVDAKSTTCHETVEGLREAVGRLAERLDVSNWAEVKAELQSMAQGR